jgi:hypothetical protein
VVEDPGRQTDRRICKPVQRLRAVRHLDGVAQAMLVEKGEPIRSAFLFQPEALMIYDLLKTDHLAVRDAWSGHFPDRELVRMANAFGVSFD